MDKLMFLMGTEAVLNTDVVCSISELVVVDVVVDVVVGVVVEVVEVVVVVEQRSVMSSKSTSVTS